MQTGKYRYFTILIIAITFIMGFSLTAIGLLDFGWPWPLPWDGSDALLSYLGFLLIAAVFLISISKWLAENNNLAFCIAVLVLTLAAGSLWPLLVVLWFFIASTMLGTWLLKKIKIETESWLNCFLIGAGIYGTIAGLMAHFPVNYPGSYGFALAFPFIFERDLFEKLFNDVKQCVMKGRNKLNASNYWLNICISTVALVHVIMAFMPEIGHDSLATHLFIPAHLLERHQWGFDVTTYVWATMPALGDWIFSVVYMLGGEAAARLINVSFIFILALLVRDIVHWAGGALFGAKWAILIFLSSPLVFTESNSLFIESIWAAFTLAGTLTFLKVCLNKESCKQQLIIAGVLLGIAVATKAATFTILLFLVVILIWQYKIWTKLNAVKPLIIGLLAFLLLGCIPYLTAWYLTKNPVFPLFNEIFQSPLWPPINFEDNRWSKGLTWDFIYKATFQTGKYMETTSGGCGFQWLLVFLPSLAALFTIFHRRGIILFVIAILSIMLSFHSTAYLRYIFPAYVVMIAIIGVGMTNISKISMMQAKVLYGFSSLAVMLNLLFLSAGPFVYRDFPITSIFSAGNRDEYLSHRLPIRNAVKQVNALNIDQTPVAVIGTSQIAGLSANALMANWYNNQFLEAFMAVKTSQDVVDLLVKSHVDFIIIDRSRERMSNQIDLLDKVTYILSQIGSVSVLKLNHDFLFNNELLLNSTFNSKDGWALSDASHFDKNTMIVSEVAPATQSVKIDSGRKYKNSVVARCYKENTQGRAQVNWMDVSGNIISPNIKVFECKSDWQEITMEVTAPINAVNAMIYISGHTSVPLEFKSVSFKQ